jgi:hypothetical protein
MPSDLLLQNALHSNNIRTQLPNNLKKTTFTPEFGS